MADPLTNLNRSDKSFRIHQSHMLPALNEPQDTWLDPIGEVAKSIAPARPTDERSPICFLLGAGASLSSGGPRTSDILLTCRRDWPRKFRSDEDVYTGFTDELAPSQRESLMRPLFDDVEPYVGYRCLAAMARSRPVFVVNLNWDSCIKQAGDRVGVPVHPFDLRDLEQGRKAVEQVLADQAGVACAHVHGFLDNPDEAYGIRFRFSYSDTRAVEHDHLELLRELLGHTTIIAGTSLTGGGDIHELVKALLPVDPDQARPLWVFERGAHRSRFELDSKTKIDLHLYEALVARNSTFNYIGNPDVDFDTMLAKLRGEETGLTWQAVGEEAAGRLPNLAKLIPPNPKYVRPLLDANRSLIVGAPRVGASTLAYLVAWWRCLTDLSNGPKRVKGLRRPEQVVEYLSQGIEPHVGAIVLDDFFDDRAPGAPEHSERLAEALAQLGPETAAIATASPDGTMAALCLPDHAEPDDGDPAPTQPPLGAIFSNRVVVQAGTLWQRDDLRAWARARGGHRAELVCREVRMGMVTTPSQAMKVLSGQTPDEFKPEWSKRLRKHLDEVYKPNRRRAQLLTMLRLQDFSRPRASNSLAKLAGVAEETVSQDPWGLCTPIGVDAERYLRLSHPGVVRVVDDWIADERETLEARLRELGEAGHWAIEALDHWTVFRETSNALQVPANFPAKDLELFGSEFVQRCIGKKPDLALDALYRMLSETRDHWGIKDVALDLVTNWDELKEKPRAWQLRNDLLANDDLFGPYALLEAILRVGRPASPDLWNPVASKIGEMAGPLGGDSLARRQVALSFDAVLWRRCPVSNEEAKKFVGSLIAAAERDRLLRAAFTAACAYHFDGFERLRSERFDPPILVGASAELDEAEEMAWIVAWHFVHQCRCRAAASRRIFQSTIDAFVRTDLPRYLDRSRHQDPLGAQHQAAVLNVIEALACHDETAGWGVHLMMNVQATMGSFDLPNELGARLSDRLYGKPPGPGMISAALTYMPSEEVRNLLEPVLENEVGKEMLQKGLGLGVVVEVVGAEKTRVVEPRFVMGADALEIRDRWNAGPHALPFEHSSLSELIERIAEGAEEAIEEELVDRQLGEQAMATIRRGYTMPIEVVTRNRNLDPGRDYTSLFVHLCVLLKDDFSRMADD